MAFNGRSHGERLALVEQAVVNMSAVPSALTDISKSLTGLQAQQQEANAGLARAFAEIKDLSVDTKQRIREHADGNNVALQDTNTRLGDLERTTSRIRWTSVGATAFVGVILTVGLAAVGSWYGGTQDTEKSVVGLTASHAATDAKVAALVTGVTDLKASVDAVRERLGYIQGKQGIPLAPGGR